jgi:biopolymer transport protein ExbB/TolQ
VIAFSALKATGGQATTAGDLSAGIAKALFHTLLGLLVALPALLVFGLYRSRVDGLCTKAMTISAELVELYCDAREGRPGGGSSHAPANPFDGMGAKGAGARTA